MRKNLELMMIFSRSKQVFYIDFLILGNISVVLFVEY